MHRLLNPFVIIVLALLVMPLVYSQEKLSEKKEVLKEVIMEDQPQKPKTEEAPAVILPTEEQATVMIEEKPEVSLTDIISTKSGLKRLTGESRLFPYNSLRKERRDPLTIPWVKKDVDAQNLFNKALDYKNKGEIRKAIATLKVLLNNFPDTSWAGKAKDELNKLDKLIKSGQFPGGEEISAPIVKLPDELRTKLSGIIWDEEEPMIILADRVLHEGDVIPELNVTVVKINKSEVVYLYKKTFFRVPLVGR